MADPGSGLAVGPAGPGCTSVISGPRRRTGGRVGQRLDLPFPSDIHYKCSYRADAAVYEWNEEKSERNLEKHGLSFEDAEQVFCGPCVTFVDDRLDYEETRLITLGSLEGRVVVTAHTPRGENTRIISMRKANAREQEIYQKRRGTA